MTHYNTTSSSSKPTHVQGCMRLMAQNAAMASAVAVKKKKKKKKKNYAAKRAACKQTRGDSAVMCCVMDHPAKQIANAMQRKVRVLTDPGPVSCSTCPSPAFTLHSQSIESESKPRQQ